MGQQCLLGLGFQLFSKILDLNFIFCLSPLLTSTHLAGRIDLPLSIDGRLLRHLVIELDLVNPLDLFHPSFLHLLARKDLTRDVIVELLGLLLPFSRKKLSVLVHLQKHQSHSAGCLAHQLLGVLGA